MPKINVTIKNMGKIRSTFAMSPVLMTLELNRAIQKSIFSIERESQIKTPVDTGRLRASHHTIFTSLRGVLDVSAFYAPFVHDGTRYMKGRPFLLEAVQDQQDTVDRNFTNAVDNVLKKLSESSK